LNGNILWRIDEKSQIVKNRLKIVIRSFDVIGLLIEQSLVIEHCDDKRAVHSGATASRVLKNALTLVEISKSLGQVVVAYITESKLIESSNAVVEFVCLISFLPSRWASSSNWILLSAMLRLTSSRLATYNDEIEVGFAS